MKELNQKELRKFILTATQAEILEYWKTVTAPKYGYTQLVDPINGKVICEVK